MNCYVLIVVLILVALIFLLVGAAGYHYIFEADGVDSFYGAALTMSGLSQEIRPKTHSQKVFIGIFALLSIGLYLVVVAAIITILLEPVIRNSISQTPGNIVVPTSRS